MYIAHQSNYILFFYKSKMITNKKLYKTKKEMSIHGLPVKLQVFLVKLVPHSLVMKIWLNQQKKPKNNTGLTTK